MSGSFYPRLARTGMQKNRRLQRPFLLTCIGTAAMFYILGALSDSALLPEMRGGQTLRIILMLGVWVIGIFSAIFLFYTNSFLIRRRKKEFGLYNILGMSKRDLGRILFWETLFSAAITLMGGLALGVLLSKLAELSLVRILRQSADLAFRFSPRTFCATAVFFCGIFFLLFLYNLIQIHTGSPAQLLRSESSGEKPPRANWFLGLLGALLLGGAYGLAVTIQSPIEAMTWFFVAVIAVIIATYLLFVSGSVLVCRLLQKNKRYYYQPQHFVSVSSMTFRMKRNGAGLASICILATMVLVMISSTACLYFGMENSLSVRYPREMNITLQSPNPEDILERYPLDELRAGIAEDAASLSLTPEDLLDYPALCFSGTLEGDRITVSETYSEAAWRSVTVLSREVYAQVTGDETPLAPGQILLWSNRGSYDQPTLAVNDLVQWEVAGTARTFPLGGNAATETSAALCVVVPDLDAAIAALSPLNDNPDGFYFFSCSWTYAFDVEGGDAKISALTDRLWDRLSYVPSAPQYNELTLSYSLENRTTEGDEYFAPAGGLFFLGIMLSGAFILAAVLIIYYKQISEGYEDQRRFQIMQNVGMTARDIRRSINSQLLLVFFAPLLMAGLHLCFAFPFIYKLLILMSLRNFPLLLGTTGISFLVFALLYLLVYRGTSNAYFNIVRSPSRAED